MKKLFKMILSLMLCTSLMSGCTSKETPGDAAYKAGTYVGVSENGRNGKLELTVKFSDTEIVSAEVTAHSETPNISDAPIAQIPELIVKNQSLNIDVIAGATITSEAILEAAAHAVEQAGGDVEALKNVAKEDHKSDEVIELTTDIVVVGAGAAGMSAAVSAADEGAESIIVFEKQANIGGNAIVSGGHIEHQGLPVEMRAANDAGYEQAILDAVAAGPQTEDEAAYWDQFVAEVEEWKKTDRSKVFDSPLWMAIEGVRTDGGDIADYLYFAETLLDFDRWMEEMGAEWNNAYGIMGYSWPRWSSIKGFASGYGFFHYLEKSIEDNNYPIDIYTSTPVTEILMNEEGEAIGVHAEAADGTQYNVLARQGVVLATGGFAGNGKMLAQYNEMWEGLTEDVRTTNTAGCTGDGILMAQEVGADVALMEVEMMFPLGDIQTGSIQGIVGDSASALFVNKEGKRFTDETGTRWDISADMFAQTDGMAYLISSQINSHIEDGKTIAGTDVESQIKKGLLYRADSIEELAEMINVPVDALVETVAAYNEMTKTHVDPDFGRQTFEPNSEIVEGPYYAYPCAPAAHITIGGVVVDYETMQVVNTEGEIIPYLFATGEVTAGQCGIDGSFAEGKVVGASIANFVERRNFE